MKIVKLDKLAGLVAALLLVCLAAPLFAADDEVKLIEAAKAGDTATVKSLLAAGTDVNAQDDYGQTALVWTAIKGHTDTMKALIDAGANVNAKSGSMTALMLATLGRHIDIVKALLDAGADMNARYKNGYTALSFAIEGGSTEIENVLRAAGAR